MLKFKEPFNIEMDNLKEIISYIIYTLIAFLDIEKDLAYALAWAMGIDTVLGICAAIFTKNSLAISRCKEERKDEKWIKKITYCWRLQLGKFKFKKLVYGFLSKLSLLLVPIIVALGAVAFNYDLKWAVTATIKLLIAADLVSSLNHILYFRTGRRNGDMDYITKIIEKLREAAIKQIDNMFNFNNNNLKNE